MSGQERAANRPELDADEETIGTYVAAFLEARESNPTLDIDQFLRDVPEPLRDGVRQAVRSLLWLEAVEPPGTRQGGDPGSTCGRFGHYRLLRQLGEGTTGSVYLAEHELLRRRVALKVLAEAWSADPRSRERFEREARAIARLHHTNIAPLFEYGQWEGRAFFAMQYIEGRSLAELLELARSGATEVEPNDQLVSLSREAQRRGGFPPELVARWGQQAAAALAHAHRQGVIHRDVKPSNLVLDQEGRLWVVDFGLAVVPDDAGLTMPGIPVGTPRYMSPEVARGEPATERSDVYSLGAVLYELLTLRPVIEGEHVNEVLERVRSFQGVWFGTRERALAGPDLAAVVTACLEPDPKQRVPSAAVLAEELERVCDGEPVRLRRWATLRRVARSMRRHAVAVTASFLLSGTIIGLAVWRHVDVAAARREAVAAARRAEEALRQARAELVRSRIADAYAWVRSETSGRRQHAITSLREAWRYLADDRQLAAPWWDAWLAARTCPDLSSIPLPTYPVPHPLESLLGESGDGTRGSSWTSLAATRARPDRPSALLGTTSDGLLFLHGDRQARVLAELPAPTATLAGCAYPWAIVTGEGGVWTVNIETGQVEQVYAGSPRAVSVAASTGRIAVVADEVAVYERGPTAWKRVPFPTPAQGQQPVAVAWDWDGKLLAVIWTEPTRLTVYAVPGGRRVWEVGLGDETGQLGRLPPAVCFLPTGQLALGMADGSVWLLSPERGVADVLRGHRSAVTACLALPDGVRLVTADARELIVWNLVQGEPLCPPLHLTDPIQRLVRWSPVEWVVGGPKGWHRVRLDPGHELYQSLPVLKRRVVAATFCGTAAVLAGADGELLVVEADGSRRRFRLADPPTKLAAPSDRLVACFFEDGRRLLLDLKTGQLRVPDQAVQEKEATSSRPSTGAIRVEPVADGPIVRLSIRVSRDRWQPIGLDLSGGRLISAVAWRPPADSGAATLVVGLVEAADGRRRVELWRSPAGGSGGEVERLGQIRPILVGRVERLAVGRDGKLLLGGGPREPARAGPGLAECWHLPGLVRPPE